MMVEVRVNGWADVRVVVMSRVWYVRMRKQMTRVETGTHGRAARVRAWE